MRISLLLENGTLEGNAAEVLAHLPENAAVRITVTERCGSSRPPLEVRKSR
jgi:hypothetical protein